MNWDIYDADQPRYGMVSMMTAAAVSYAHSAFTAPDPFARPLSRLSQPVRFTEPKSTVPEVYRPVTKRKIGA